MPASNGRWTRRARSPGPNKIVVRQGTYYLTRTLELDHRDSGLIIEGDGGPVVLSGGRRVTGWKPWKGNVRQADLSGLDLPDLSFRQLYYNTKLQPWARVPNFDPQHPRTGGFLQNAGVVEAGTKTKFRYREGDLHPERWAHPERAWIMFHDSLNYETQFCPVKAVDRENRVVEAQQGVYVLSLGQSVLSLRPAGRTRRAGRVVRRSGLEDALFLAARGRSERRG